MEEMPVERSLYRALERAGKYFPVLLDRHQNLIAKHGLVDPNQLIDLTLFLRRKLSGGLKNVKLLKKFLIDLTLTTVYPKKQVQIYHFE